MAITLPDPLDWVDRIKNLVPDLQLVGIWEDITKLMEDSARQIYRFPAALVIPNADRTTGGNTVNPYVSQIVTASWGVMIGVRSYRDQSGTDAGDTLRGLREKIMEALLGWQQETTQITYAGGRVMSLGDGMLWWQDNFEHNYLVRVTA